jgi:hypothetical protein
MGWAHLPLPREVRLAPFIAINGIQSVQETNINM